MKIEKRCPPFNQGNKAVNIFEDDVDYELFYDKSSMMNVGFVNKFYHFLDDMLDASCNDRGNCFTCGDNTTHSLTFADALAY